MATMSTVFPYPSGAYPTPTPGAYSGGSSPLDPTQFNQLVLNSDYAPSLRNQANPYQYLQGIAGSTPLTQSNWRYYESQIPQQAQTNYPGPVWTPPGTGTTPTNRPAGGITPVPAPVPGQFGGHSAGGTTQGAVSPVLSPGIMGGIGGRSTDPVTDPAAVQNAPTFTFSNPPPPENATTQDTVPDYNKIFNPTGYDGNTIGYDATTPPPTTMPGGYPTGAQTLNQSMYPWLSSYQGNFTAPMTPYENQGLTGISNFVGGGQNLGGAQNYVSNVLSGQYLDPSTNPNLQKYIDSLSGIHDYQDDLQRQRIGSSMAAGGNALSGARVSAEEQYQNESNNQYENMIASMLNQNYQNERGLQNSAVPLQMGLSNQTLGGYNNLMQAGALPRNLQQQENTAQYGDWLRQIAGMQQAFQQPQQNMLALLHSGYPGSSQPNYGTSQATGWAALLSALLGGGGTGTGGTGTGGVLGGLGSLISGLLGPGTVDNPQDLGGSTQVDQWGNPVDPNNPPYDPYSDYSGGASTGGYYGPDVGSSTGDDYSALEAWLAQQQGNP